MANTELKIATEVLLVGFNMMAQIAVDKQDNIWTIDGWYDEDTGELDMYANLGMLNWEEWEYVEYVTAWAIIDGYKVWTAFRPDDFDKPTEG